jgi:hypothetical protein
LDELPIYEPGQNPQSQPLAPSQSQNDNTSASVSAPRAEIQSSSVGETQPAYTDAPPSYESALVGNNTNSNN